MTNGGLRYNEDLTQPSRAGVRLKAPMVDKTSYLLPFLVLYFLSHAATASGVNDTIVVFTAAGQTVFMFWGK